MLAPSFNMDVMQGENGTSNRDNALFIEVGLRQIKALAASIQEHGPVVRKGWIEAPCLKQHGEAIVFNEGVLREFLKKHFSRPGLVVIVIDPSVTLQFLESVPQGIASTIHKHIAQEIGQREKIDLSNYYWTVTPLAQAAGKIEELTAASFEEQSVVVSAARRQWVSAMESVFQELGWRINRILFQQSSLIRAFQFFGGSALAQETVGLLHLNQDRYSLAIVHNGHWISNREGQTKGFEKLKTDIKSFLAANAVRLRLQVRCLFVSADGTGADSLTQELKEIGCYARTWIATRKISFAGTPCPVLLSEGAQFNALVGAMLIESDCRRYESEESQNTVPLLETIREQLTRPLQLAACAAVCANAYFGILNHRTEARLSELQSELKLEQETLKTVQTTNKHPQKQLAELELFRASRKSWPDIVSQIRNIQIQGVALSQITVVDSLVAVETSPSEARRRTKSNQQWRTSGSMVLEARNAGGLVALEQFINAVKGNGYIRPLLHKKKPARILNNVEVADATPPLTVFTVEYPLEDTTL